MKCDKCNKEMTNPKTNVTHIGYKIAIGEVDKDTKEFLLEQFGKYSDKEEYNFCWECFLDTFMKDKVYQDKNEVDNV
jgi:hypothetical protein